MNRIEITDDVKRWWRLYSVHAMLIGAVCDAASVGINTSHLFAQQAVTICGVLGFISMVGGVIGRFIKQDPADAARMNQ